MERETRNQRYHLLLNNQERVAIEERMKQAGINQMSTYIRKMAIDGYILKLDLPEIKEMISLLRYSSNNLNQIARRANETGRVYEDDLRSISGMQEKIWDGINQILVRLGQVE
ncbi:MAG: plasmid mobilization relaxosome protein MobC [Solobacterium sp.]|nr:plasmid mobilization relaxosome protein MobC [Solobacterium sp.]